MYELNVGSYKNFIIKNVITRLYEVNQLFSLTDQRDIINYLQAMEQNHSFNEGDNNFNYKRTIDDTFAKLDFEEQSNRCQTSENKENQSKSKYSSNAQSSSCCEIENQLFYFSDELILSYLDISNDKETSNWRDENSFQLLKSESHLNLIPDKVSTVSLDSKTDKPDKKDIGDTIFHEHGEVGQGEISGHSKKIKKTKKQKESVSSEKGVASKEKLC